MCSEYIILINISKGIRNVNFVLLCWYVVNCGKYFTYISFICLGNSDDIKQLGRRYIGKGDQYRVIQEEKEVLRVKEKNEN